MWIIFTLLAALFQTFRNIFSKKVSMYLSNTNVSLCRFLFGLPFAILGTLTLYLLGNRFSIIIVPFILTSFGMAFFQLLANILLIELFRSKNFATSLTLIKIESIILAILGIFLLNEIPTLTGWIGIIIATSGLIFAGVTNTGMNNIKLKSSLLALGAGISLAVCTIFIKKTYLYINYETRIMQVAVTLTTILFIQTILSLLLLKKEKYSEIKIIFKKPLQPILIGLFAVVGSFSWFSAFSLNLVVYVRTLGQVEFIFGLLASYFLFNEKIKSYEVVGMCLLIIGTVLLFI